jgi:hypothetical protein
MMRWDPGGREGATAPLAQSWERMARLRNKGRQMQASGGKEMLAIAPKLPFKSSLVIY